jgi:hypothetical protein
MRIASLITLGCLMAGGVMAGECVTVHVKGDANLPLGIKQQAALTVSSLFDEVGVSVSLTKRAEAANCVTLEISVVAVSPVSAPRGVLGYAMPFRNSGTEIVILLDRVLRVANGNKEVLGHVIAHEIAHVLEGVDRHSPDGVMKAHWNTKDYCRMMVHGLHFSPDEAELIHLGFERRLTPVALLHSATY